MAAQEDEVGLVLVCKLDNPFGRLTFHEVSLGWQAGLLQAERQIVHIGFGFGFPNLPIQRINRAGLAGQVGRVHHMQESDLRLKGPGNRDDVRQDALG